jgi:hypothetical protein
MRAATLWCVAVAKPPINEHFHRKHAVFVW